MEIGNKAEAFKCTWRSVNDLIKWSKQKNWLFYKTKILWPSIEPATCKILYLMQQAA